MDKKTELFGRRRWSEAPPWKCPRCGDGTLVMKKDGSQSHEHGWSQDAHSHEAWEPEWISGIFQWTLQCSIQTCLHQVVTTGEYVVDWDVEDGPNGQEQVYKDFYLPKAFSEAPPIINLKVHFPDEIQILLTDAFSIFWVDVPSCLNKLRQCIEEILTIKKIARYAQCNGKRKSLTLHSRILRYEAKNKDAGELLMALKWLGNEGSHSSKKAKNLQRGDVLEAFDILEYALDVIFSPKKKAIGKKAKKIMTRKGF